MSENEGEASIRNDSVTAKNTSDTTKLNAKEDNCAVISMPYHASNLVVVEGTLVHILGKVFKIFSKYVKVFDLYIVATAACPNYKVLHGATVLYQYIDNNDDGIPDNELAYANLKAHKATMIMFSTEEELEKHSRLQEQIPEGMIIQDLEADETRPGSILPHAFDEALEECFHLVTQGFVLAYPNVFGLEHGSQVSLMMDSARGGYFKKVPRRYPETAWFTYYDKTCDYQCMLTEYMYWAMTTILGAQRYRKAEIEDEWRPSTRAEIEVIDNPVYKLMTDPIYQLPTKLPVPVSGMPLYDHVQNQSACVKCKRDRTSCCSCCGNIRSAVTKLFKKFKL